MKKLSFFLMAMLFSVMSFAATETISCPAGTVVSSKITMDFKSLTFLQEQGSSTSAVKAYSPWRIYKNHKVTFTPQTDVTIENLVITCTGSDYAKNGTLTNATATLSGTTLTITPTDGTQAFTFAATVAQVRWQKIVVTYKVAGEVVAVEAPKFDVTTSNFTEAFSLNITSAEGTTLKYTTDTTDPATSATAVVINTNTATVAIPAKSTMVRAIAIKGEDVSEEKETTYCYVNSPATAYTVAEAMEVIDAGLGLTNELYVKGEISTIEKYDANYGSITYWIKDEEGNKFECYSGLGLNKAKFTKKEDLVVGSKVVVCGTMKKYNTTYEFNYNNYIVSLELPVVKYTVTATAENGTVEGAGEYEENAEATLTATAADGYEFTCWTSGEDTVSTANPYTFVVTADVALVANFEEAAPDYMVIEDNITNLVIDLENMAIIGGPSTMWQVDVYLGLAEDDNMDGQWSLSPESSVAIMGFDARFIDGYVYDIDINAPAAKAVLHVEDNGSFYEIKLDMTNTPTEAIVVVVEDATVQIDTVPMFGDVVEYALKMTANWTYAEDSLTYPVLVEVPVYYPEATEPSEMTCTVTIGGEGDDDPWLGFGEGTLTITTVDGVVTAKGIVANPYTGVAFDITVSGKLPAAEPVKHTVTITVNPEGAGTVTGAGEYEDGAEVTVKAEENEGYIFLGWMEDGEFVAEDYEYTFTILNDVDLVAVYATQLVGVAEDLVITETALTATAILSTGTTLTVNLVLGEYDEEQGAYWLAETTTLTLGDKALTLLDGLVMVNAEQQTAIAVVLAEHEGVFYAFTLMLAAPASGVDNINTNVAPRKVIRDGQLIIIKNGVEYNVQGATLK